MDGGDGVLVLTDLYGASPSNLAGRLARLGTPVRRVSALSLPMPAARVTGVVTSATCAAVPGTVADISIDCAIRVAMIRP